ncbi:conserved hypothetical protein [Ricinus communis]|uniref:Uncharacterized protein n=1 Tax=Ricinus communis TaxID=3988 RepID=B9SS85_RICCO|nr:conserved hypothetical protein [Ricinus communis]
MPVVPAFLTAAVSIASLAYNAGKDATKHIGKKIRYSKNLRRNYKALHWEAGYISGLSAKIGHVIHKRGLKSLKIYRRWNRSVWEAVGEAKTLCRKYEGTRKSWVFRRAKLSKKMAESVAKVEKLAKNGIEMGKLLSSTHGHKKRRQHKRKKG